MSLETFKDILTSPRFWLSTAFLTVAIKIIWFLISELIKWLKFMISSKIRKFEVKLDLDYDYLKSKVTFSCLLVRYGTDNYIRYLASEQEKYEGRLQNKIIKLDIEPLGDRSYKLVLSIPIHKRIGTQFKCFVEAESENDAREVERAFEKCDNIEKVDISTSPYRNRVYFIIKKFRIEKTVDELENNFCFPE